MIAGIAKKTAIQKLQAQWDKNRYLCVGLDPDYARTPPPALQNDATTLRARASAYYDFCCRIIYLTSEYTAAFKPNTAFFERLGHEGIKALELVCTYIRQQAPDALLIYDGKRGDIGNTNEGYAAAAFDICGADAITLSPYLGGVALEPFLRRTDKLCFVLARTSNEGAGEFQDFLVDANGTRDVPLYETVARRVAATWNRNGNVGLVAGATYPHELAKIRQAAPDLPLLIPGIGAQGGDLKAAVRAGLDAHFRGILVNSSRGIIYADDPREAARKTHEDLLQAVEEFRALHRR